MPALLGREGLLSGHFGHDTQITPINRATLAVLDTFIQTKTQVPASTVHAIAHDFPAQAAILVSRLPAEESRDTLNAWTYDLAETDSDRTLPRVAAMMLAKDPDPNFVARMVATSEEVLTVSVVATGGYGGGMGGGGCGDSVAHGPTPGWPTAYIYRLSENDPSGGDSTIIDLDGDRISFRRVDASEGWGSCSWIAPLNPVTRHRLIAYWLGLRDDAMSWMPEEDASIVWTTRGDYDKQLGGIVEEHLKQLRATVDALHQRGLLTDEQSPTVPPRLVVTVQCMIKPCPLGAVK